MFEEHAGPVLVNVELNLQCWRTGLSVPSNSRVKTKQHPPSKIAPFFFWRSLQLYYSVT